MKYIEELDIGDTFTYKDHLFVLTSDFKSNGFRLCYSLISGQPSWLTNQTMIEHNPIYILDKDNNTIPVKITAKQDVAN